MMLAKLVPVAVDAVALIEISLDYVSASAIIGCPETGTLISRKDGDPPRESLRRRGACRRLAWP
jgi:hypothetical protein